MKILVIEACGLHLAYLGCYGNAWVATPNLDRLAAEGIVCDFHIVDRPELTLTTPLTRRSAGTGRFLWAGAHIDTRGSAEVVALAAGIDCHRHRCPTFADFARAKDAVRAWRRGEAPVLWVEGPSLLPPWEMPDDMLGLYDEEDEELLPWPDPPLGPAALSDDELRCVQNTYAGAVTYWDALLGTLLDDLRTAEALDELIVCVTARSGLPLAEHGVLGVLPARLHEELVHVPLLWRLPHALEGGRRVAALTQPVDLLPTFGELLGIPTPDVHGHSLRPLMRGQLAAVRPYACAALHAAGAEEWLLRTPDWSFHLPMAPGENPARLYVKPDDRWEVNDVASQRADLVERLETTLRAFGQATRQAELAYPPLDPTMA